MVFLRDVVVVGFQRFEKTVSQTEKRVFYIVHFVYDASAQGSRGQLTGVYFSGTAPEVGEAVKVIYDPKSKSYSLVG